MRQSIGVRRPKQVADLSLRPKHALTALAFSAALLGGGAAAAWAQNAPSTPPAAPRSGPPGGEAPGNGPGGAHIHLGHRGPHPGGAVGSENCPHMGGGPGGDGPSAPVPSSAPKASDPNT